jgi:hypothetical protein
MVLQKVISRRKKFFVDLVKVTDEIAGSGSIGQGCGPGSVPKCHGYATLVYGMHCELGGC